MLRSPFRFLFLTLLLTAVWLLLSGVYLPRLIVTGFVVSAIITFIMDRVGLLDEEALPLYLVPRGPAYWLWLVGEIVKSALNVTRIILDPKLPVSPTMITFSPSQKSDIGRVIHANSITLTPGTIATGISAYENTIQVHGIEREGAEGCVKSEMDLKVTQFERTKGER